MTKLDGCSAIYQVAQMILIFPSPDIGLNFAMASVNLPRFEELERRLRRFEVGADETVSPDVRSVAVRVAPRAATRFVRARPSPDQLDSALGAIEHAAAMLDAFQSAAMVPGGLAGLQQSILYERIAVYRRDFEIAVEELQHIRCAAESFRQRAEIAESRLELLMVSGSRLCKSLSAGLAAASVKASVVS